MVDSSGHTSVAQVTITIQGANDAPTITSNGGGSTASITMAENITAVTTVVGSDVDAGTTFTYSIIGGADAARFSITAGGSLAFVAAPDFEAPTDVGGDNIYDVIVQVSDGSLTTLQAIAVTIPTCRTSWSSPLPPITTTAVSRQVLRTISSGSMRTKARTLRSACAKPSLRQQHDRHRYSELQYRWYGCQDD